MLYILCKAIRLENDIMAASCAAASNRDIDTAIYFDRNCPILDWEVTNALNRSA